MELDPELLDGRIGYHDESLPFVLLWSEKAGCTALLTWFLHHAGHLEEASTYGRWVHHWEIDVMRKQPRYLDRLRERILEGVPVFQLVRNPFDRAVSSYLTLLEFEDGAEHLTIPMRNAVRRLVYGRDDVSYSFSIRHYLRWLAEQDIDHIDGHHRAQTTELDARLAELGIPVTHLRLERLDDELAGLERRFGLAPVDRSELTEPPHHVARADRPFPDRSAVADLQPGIPLVPGTIMPRASDFMADDVIDAVARIFHRDIAAFGYDRPDPAAP
jgi:hypothetical protein